MSNSVLKVTKRQRDLLTILYKYIRDTGYPPTFEEMRESLRVTSNQSVIDLLNHLEDKKLIKRKEGIARSIAILPLGYEALGKPPLAPFLGVTTAGIPVESLEIKGEWRELSNEVRQLQEDIFLLQVAGDSMINAGIDDGDLVLVKEEKEFVSGDIVLANVDGEATIKRFISDDTPPFIYLKPENPKYKVIPFTERVRLIGKIISRLSFGAWENID